MKKTFLYGALACTLAVSATLGSCSKKADNNAEQSSEACEFLSEATVDSLSEFQGKVNAMNLLNEFNSLPDSVRAKFNKDDLMRGYQQVLSNADNQSFLTGLNLGMRAIGEITQVENMQGIKLNKKVLFNAFSNIFMKDSIPAAQRMEIENTYRALQTTATEARQRMIERQAQANLAAGQQYVDSLMANGANLQKTAKGLYYKVAVQGDTMLVQPTSRVKVRYTGMLTDGKVFDTSDNAPDSVVTLNLQSVVPGFAEGIRLLGVGGKGTLYIPGDLGYGVRGNQMAGIGANEMIVFNLQVVEATPGNQPAVPRMAPTTK